MDSRLKTTKLSIRQCGSNANPCRTETGTAVRHIAADLREVVAFIGEIVAKLPTTIWNRKRMRWPEVRRVFELAGANAVPIISLISVLVGLIIAFEAAEQLAKFGAQIYVANMIGLIMVRELGPLLAAIMLAGRSGSAFAAEIGTMKVNEELNALETFGLDPIRFLVVQRITAGILLTPLLTFYAALMGVLGGVLVTLGLGFPLALIINQITSTVQLSDVALAHGQRRGFWRDCFRCRMFAWPANAAGAERGRRFHHARGRDQHTADHHRRRHFLNPLLCPDVMSR